MILIRNNGFYKVQGKHIYSGTACFQKKLRFAPALTRELNVGKKFILKTGLKPLPRDRKKIETICLFVRNFISRLMKLIRSSPSNVGTTNAVRVCNSKY